MSRLLRWSKFLFARSLAPLVRRSPSKARRGRRLFAELLESRRCLSAYHVTVLGSLGSGGVTPTAINSSGQIAGNANVGGQTHAFLYSAGSLTDLGSLGGGYSYAFGLNDSGQVVGASSPASGPNHAFLYSGGSMQDLGTLGNNGGESAATAINDAGQIAGYSETGPGTPNFAFLYDGGVMSGIGSFGGYSNAYGINEHTQIVGHSSGQAFVWSSGVMTPIPNALAASAINENGEVTGQSFGGPGNAQSHAFLYADGVTTDLGTLGGAFSVGNAINDAGEIVGLADTASQGQHGFLYAHGILQDLTSLVEPGYIITGAFGINNKGQIAATGVNTTTLQTEGLLLTPTSFDAVADFSNNFNDDSSNWTYRYSFDQLRDGNYDLLPTNSRLFNWWNSPQPYWNTGVFDTSTGVGVNADSASIPSLQGPFNWPGQTVFMAPSALAVVSWQSPLTYDVDISFSFSELQPGGSDGISYFVDLNDGSGQLASGSLADLGGTGTITLHHVSVAAGDHINFIVDRNATNAFDCVAMTAAISPAAAIDTTTIVNVSDATYDGLPHGGTAVVTASGLNQPLVVSYTGVNGTNYPTTSAAPINAGDYVASASYPGDGQYLPSSDSKSFSIHKAGAGIVVTPYNVIYDGHFHTATGNATGVNGESLTNLLSLAGTTHINAGSYTDHWTFAGDANYNSAAGDIGDFIQRADALFSIIGYDVPYDGHVHVATGSATGVNGENLSALLNLSGTSHTAIGSYSDPWAFTGNTNYRPASGQVSDRIFPANTFLVETQAALNVDKSGDIVATVTATTSLNQTALSAVASGAFPLRFMFTNSLGVTVSVPASLVAGSHLGAQDRSLALSYRNPGAGSPLSALVTPANSSASKAMTVRFSAQVKIGDAWFDLGSETIKAFSTKTAALNAASAHHLVPRRRN